MSTMTSAPVQDTSVREPTVDVSATPGIPLPRLVRVELRKMADTRSGKWLLIGIGVITLAVIGIFYATADQADRTFFNFMAATNGPQGLLLPVLGILLVTSEWTQRTALVSFTLTPVRSRVLLAKVLGGLIAGMAAIALAVVVAVLATLIGGAENAWAQVGVDDLGKFVLLQATGILQGLAFGLLFLNSSAAIVSYFVLPTALNILGTFWTAMAEVQPWFDLWSSQSPLFLGGNLTSEQWAQCATSSVIWVVLPFVIGLVRVLKAEVK
jgi:ABC-type transport system involved in multi-copper enzyme maturation permease subunit